MLKRKKEIDEGLKRNPYNDVGHTKFDLIDDFEESMKQLMSISSQRNFSIPWSCRRNIAKSILALNNLHREGTTDLDKFLYDLYKRCKKVYITLCRISNPDDDILKISNNLSDKFKIVESLIN